MSIVRTLRFSEATVARARGAFAPEVLRCPISIEESDFMDMLRLVIVYIHLIACCVAIGLVLTSDIAMVKQLFRRGSSISERHELEHLQHVVANALAVLWATGALILAVDAADKGLGYFANPKLQAKIGLVVLLTANGVLLHRVVMPLLQKSGSLLRLSFNNLVLAIFAGTVSAVTWFYAAFMGVGRSLSWKYSLVELLAAYPLMIGGGICSMLALSAWARFSPEQEQRDYGETMAHMR
jgi:hypothetical protein